MTCQRCDGFMVNEDLMDLLESKEMLCRGWRCINCGETVDHLVIKNRENPLPEPLGSKRRWKKVVAV